MSHEYALHGQGSSIHASCQLKLFHTQFDEHSKIVHGQQQLVTLEGYTIPISIDSGLTYICPVHVPSDHDIQTLAHVVFTSPQEWDQNVLDHGINLELLPDPDSAPDQYLLQEFSFDEFGEPKESIVMLLNTLLDAPTQECHKQTQKPALINWVSLCPYLGFQSEEVIKATYQSPLAMLERFPPVITSRDTSILIIPSLTFPSQ